MRRFGLIGYPLTHSFSKSFFAEKFEREQLFDCSYENFPLTGIGELSDLIKNTSGLEGLNVTIPYKESVLTFLDDRTDLVDQTGACNCIKIAHGRLTGYNTDVAGFERSLLNKLQLQPHQRALILGTGGAAKAVAFVLAKNGIAYTIVSRQPSAYNLVYDQVTPFVIAEHTLIINTTPLGMYPKTGEMPPIPYNALTSRHFLFDLVYNPEKTLFLENGEKRGAAIQNGYDMLVYQAEESWKIWNSAGG